MLLVLHDAPRLGSKILLNLVQLLSDRLRQTSAKRVSDLEASREARAARGPTTGRCRTKGWRARLRRGAIRTVCPPGIDFAW